MKDFFLGRQKPKQFQREFARSRSSLPSISSRRSSQPRHPELLTQRTRTQRS